MHPSYKPSSLKKPERPRPATEQKRRNKQSASLELDVRILSHRNEPLCDRLQEDRKFKPGHNKPMSTLLPRYKFADFTYSVISIGQRALRNQ